MNNTPQKPAVPGAAAPGAAAGTRPDPKPPVGVRAPEGMVRHDAQGKGILTWAAETARHLALTTSTVLRRLDNQSLSIDDTAPRGERSSRASAMPGDGFNPYESGSRTGRGSRDSAARGAQPARTAPLPGRGGAGARRAAPPPPRPRSPWWQRLFGRD